MKSIYTILFLLFSFYGFSQQLTYKPINPAFGGDTFNYQWLLSSANAQNSFEDPSAGREDRTTLGQFADNLNRQLLNQLSRGLFGDQLGQGLEEGTFTFGSLALEIFETLEGLVINILDTNTGEQTQIVIPN
ncbi:MAG: curli production assembly/transport component CsgF [Flavobacteriaceae bacterium]